MNEPRRRIDLNADLGEGFPHDDALLAIVSSANVCAGAYAGSPALTAATIAKAAALGRRIGAHVGYPDRDSFGRAASAIPLPTLASELERQLAVCLAAADAAGTRIAYVKPHGALYHAAVAPGEEARLLLRLAHGHGLGVMHQPDTALTALATEEGIACHVEGFADRRYLPSGRLIPRSESGATLTDPAEMAAQVLELARGTRHGRVDTICIHGDDARALQSAQHVRDALVGAGFDIVSPSVS